MSELETLREILSAAQDTGLAAFYWWLAYNVFTDVVVVVLLVLAGKGLARGMKYAAENNLL